MKAAIIAGCVMLSVLSAPGAHATEDGCAVVLKTPDGFLNVRAKPKMGSRILKRVKPGETIGFDTAGGEGDDKDEWVHVYIPERNLWGWVYYRFIVGVDCEQLDALTTDKVVRP
jgi:hypothetical protein